MSFHVFWHVAPATTPLGPHWRSPRGDVPTLLLASAALQSAWEISFEEAIQALEALPGMYCEWDGAWVWHPARDRQVEGVLFDRERRLAFVELKGDCTGVRIDQLAAAIHRGVQPLVVQLPREGVLLSWSTWRSTFFD